MTRGVSVSENSANVWEISNRGLDNCKRSDETKPSGKLFAVVTNGPKIGSRYGYINCRPTRSRVLAQVGVVG